MIDAALDAEYSLAIIKMQTAHVSPRAVVRVLHDAWGYKPTPLRKAMDDTPTSAGDHGDPEIARQEKAFYDALTSGQKAAYKDVQELVYQLWNTGQSWDGIDAWKIGEPIDEWQRKAAYELATHPQKAYMLGQMLASEALKTPLHRPLLPTDGRAINFLQQTTFNEIDDAFNSLKGDLRRALIDGMVNGDNPKTVASKLSAELKDWETWWNVISITETSRAESIGRLQEFADADVELCIGSSAHDTRACDPCLTLIDGKIYKVSYVQGNNNYGRRQADWLPCIPLHPRCRCLWAPYKKGDAVDVTDDPRTDYR